MSSCPKGGQSAERLGKGGAQAVRAVTSNPSESRKEPNKILGLRAWKLALAGPAVYWYFPVFYVLMSTQPGASPIGLAALMVVMMLSASWGFLLNDLSDREADAKGGRADELHGHGLSKEAMVALVLITAIGSWVVVFLIGGGYVFKAVLAVDYLIATMYSLPPLKLKLRRFWGFLANSLMERPLPILVFLAYMNYYAWETLLLPVLMELTWSVFKHQAADVKADIEAKVTTFAAYLGEKRSSRIVQVILNPVSVFSLLFLIALAWVSIPSLRPLLAVCFALSALSTAGALVAERLGRFTTYITSTDPPYIIALNLSYKYIVLVVLAYGIISSRADYYLMVILLGVTLGYQAYAYRKIVKGLRRGRPSPTAPAPPSQRNTPV